MRDEVNSKHTQNLITSIQKKDATLGNEIIKKVTWEGIDLSELLNTLTSSKSTVDLNYFITHFELGEILMKFFFHTKTQTSISVFVGIIIRGGESYAMYLFNNHKLDTIMSAQSTDSGQSFTKQLKKTFGKLGYIKAFKEFEVKLAVSETNVQGIVRGMKIGVLPMEGMLIRQMQLASKYSFGNYQLGCNRHKPY